MIGPVLPKELLKERRAEVKRLERDLARESRRGSSKRAGYGPRLPKEVLKSRKAELGKLKRDLARDVKRSRSMSFAGKFGKRFAGGVDDPLYKRALRDALKIIGRKIGGKKKKRGKKNFAERMRAGERYNARTASKTERALYLRALDDARRVGVRPGKKRVGRSCAPRKKKKVASRAPSKMAQVALAAARGAPTSKLSAAAALAKRWRCEGPRRTGCGGSGSRVVRRVR